MLPGKLCIGILEEDNPLKSYFRVKPVIIYNEGNYELFAQPEAFPAEGCLRIVPDKNESGRFKTRMRKMGRYCILDLRNHPASNDKIRANKNFGMVPGEQNANIVYSDVIREPVEGMILEIAADMRDETVATPQFLVDNGTDIYHFVPEASGQSMYAEPDGSAVTEDEISRFEINVNGKTIRIAVRLGDAYMPELAKTHAEPVEHKTVLIAEPEPRPSDSSVMPESKPEPKPETAPAEPEMAEEESAEPVIRKRDSSVHQLLSSQSGMNPKRKMSLQEIIDEKWRRSREDQLGHPVPGAASSQPVESPVESAVQAIRKAWENSDTREQLTDMIVSMNDVTSLIDQKLHDENGAALRHALEDLEADRLKTLGEIDRLRKEKASLRETFKAEIREDEAKAFASAVEKTKAAEKQLQVLNNQIEKTRSDANALQDVLASLGDGRFEAELKAFALKKRCLDTIIRLGRETPEAVPEVSPDRAEWISRTRYAFEKRGLLPSTADIAEFLICAALGDTLILSGPACSDRRLTADSLADALGASASGRYLHTSNASHPPMPPEFMEKLRKNCDVPGICLITESNAEPFPGHIPCEKAARFITVREVSDQGCPLSQEQLEAGWFIRLAPVPAASPWKITGTNEVSLAPASMQSLRDAFLKETDELPAKITECFAHIRQSLATYGVYLSRRILNDMWSYCASITDVCSMPAQEALDRAFARRAMPFVLASAPIECLKTLNSILAGMPMSLALLKQPLPISI